MTTDALEEKTFENIVRKEEHASNKHFLLFLQWFLSYEGQHFE